jgi:hypothetical protein
VVTWRTGVHALALVALLWSAASEGRGNVASPLATSDDRTFTDTSNDSVGRIDIRTVRVSNSGDRLDVRVNLAQKTIGTTEHVGITLDFDGDHRRDIQFYFDGTGGGTLEHIRYPSPGTFETTPASLGTFSNNDFGVTFNLRLGALGSPAKFDFYAFSKERDEPRIWDVAPDGADWWSFVVQAPPGPERPPGGGGGGGGTARDFVARGTTIFPRRPEAGGTVIVSTRFVFRTSGQLVRAGRLACRGTAGARNVVGRPYTTNRDHFCAFDLPRSSGGTKFTGRVTLSLSGRTKTAQRSARVMPASALRLRGPSTNGDPRAGHQFAALFLVELVRGTSSKQINDGLVTCRASVGGRSLRDSFNGFDAARRGKLAVCTWDIPASAKGSTFLATVTVTNSGLIATKTFTRRVRAG